MTAGARAARTRPISPRTLAAFAAIDADPAHLLMVGELTPGEGTRKPHWRPPVLRAGEVERDQDLAEPFGTNRVSACSSDMPLVSGTLNITKKNDAAANRAYMA
ncbi:MAG: hypothetical protein JWM50_1032 [Microbacteriaceae bacterium]|nr:hypothetical protein [Microbacteriaceae bacterium]